MRRTSGGFGGCSESSLAMRWPRRLARKKERLVAARMTIADDGSTRDLAQIELLIERSTFFPGQFLGTKWGHDCPFWPNLRIIQMQRTFAVPCEYTESCNAAFVL